MKKMKKILSVILTLAMVLGMSVTTFAAEKEYEPISEDATGKASDKGTITIDGFYMVNKGTAEEPDWKLPEGLTVKAYQIVKAVYANNETYKDEEGKKVGNNDGSFSSYVPVYGEDEVPGNVIKVELPKDTQTEANKMPAISVTEPQLSAIWNYIEKTNKKIEDEGEGTKIAPTGDVITVGTADTSVTVGDKTIKTVEINTATNNASSTEDKDHTFTIRIPNLPVGSYLIAVTNSENKIYNPIVASIYYNVNSSNTGNTMDQANFSITSTPSWVKVTDHPGVKKDVVTKKEENGTVTSITNENHSSANIGDTIHYQVVIDPIPSYGGEYPELKMVDSLSQGLSYKADSLKVEVYKAGTDLTVPANVAENSEQRVATLTKGTNYTPSLKKVAIQGSNPAKTTDELTVDFVSSKTEGEDEKTVYTYGLKDYAGMKAVVTYDAVLTEDALINEGGNENGVKLSYTKDSRISGTDGKPTPEPTIESKTYSYTFDIDGGVAGEDVTTTITKGMLEKVGEVWSSEDNEYKYGPLDGAEFTLYNSNPEEVRNDPNLTTDKQKEDKLKEITYKQVIDGKEVFGGIVTSKAGGRLPIRGLAAGTYYLQETKAPAGYSLNAQVFEIKIEATYHNEDSKTTVKVTDADGKEVEVPQYRKGELDTWKITINGADLTANATGTGKVENAFKVDHQGTTTEKIVHINNLKPGDDGYDEAIKKVQIKNTRLASLPSTGGIGTTIFTFGGCAIMILAAALFFISRRRSAK